jgi:hypothetical protein
VIGIDIGKNSFHIVGLDKRSSNQVPSPAVALQPCARLLLSLQPLKLLGARVCGTRTSIRMQ